MTINEPTFGNHLAELAAQWERSLAEQGFAAAVLPAGETEMYFQDDQAPPFHPNPHFARWFPADDCEHSVLLLRPGEQPKLHFYQPADYWHLPPTLPSWAEDAFAIEPHGSVGELRNALAQALAKLGRVAVVGPSTTMDLNLPADAVNPQALTNQLAFARAVKTPFELACLRKANELGARGHIAARDAFYGGGSEFDIHMAYLAASSQQESKLPYQNIVALNEHAAVLHYQHYDRTRPERTRSFLIDAGARSGGYHSDITRTYSATPGDEFDALVQAMDEKQQALVAAIQPGSFYTELQEAMHHAVGDLLARFGFIGCSAESAFEQRITDAFVPHGLGHLLGLQTHDVGGRLANERGDTVQPPERFPTLRYTRSIEVGHVVTMEPGLYFIPVLLDKLADSDASKDVNWAKVTEFLSCGGVRIEDDVAVGEHATENLTRQAFAKLADSE